MKKLNNLDEFKQITDDTFFLLKNSTTCPISQAALEEYEKFAEDYAGNMYFLNVQDARELSNQLAEQFQVRHESPQAFLIQNGDVKWHDSHWAITYSKLEEVEKQFTK